MSDANKLSGGMLEDLEDEGLSSGAKQALTRRYFEHLKKGVPHLSQYRYYPWHREFKDAALIHGKRERLVSGANQIGKSMVSSLENIEWATERHLWPKLWPKLIPDKTGRTILNTTVPENFWFFHTDGGTSLSDFKRWEEKYLPKLEIVGEDHPVYGWSHKKNKERLLEISFNSGVSIIFKTFTQDVTNLQGGTIFKAHSDEELPYEIWAELLQRLAIPEGYFSMVCAATKGQTQWRLCFENRGTQNERWKGAYKRQVSKYDSIYFEDGTESGIVTKESIDREKELLSPREIEIRIHGKFAPLEGLLINKFSAEKNLISSVKQLDPEFGFDEFFETDLEAYFGVDIGSGNVNRSPSAITVGLLNRVGDRMVMPYVWRGDRITTTASDVVEMVRMLMQRFKNTVRINYDPAGAGADFGTLASRMGLPVSPAKKDRVKNLEMINSLFSTRSLFVMGDMSDENTQVIKLISEFQTITQMSTKKKVSERDDLIDSTRYMLESVPFDFDLIMNRGLPVDVEKKVIRGRIYDSDHDQERWEHYQRHIKEDDEDGEEFLVGDIFHENYV